MHDIQTTATDDHVCQSVCLSRDFTWLRCAKTAERPVCGEDSWGPRNIVLDGGPDPPTARGGGSAFDAAFAKLLWPLTGLHMH